MKTFILSSIFIGICSYGLSASAVEKICTGGENCESTLGCSIVIDYDAKQLELKQTPKNYDDAEGSYDYVGIKNQAGVDYLTYQGDDPGHQDGYRFMLDEKTGKMLLRMYSGPEGTLDAVYVCHDRK